MAVLTSQMSDFPRWYQDVLVKAELAETGPVRGTTTSWGSSTRMIGGLSMAHGDDAGLRLPPRVAPVQVILVAIKDAPGVSETIARLQRELGDLGIRVRADRRTDIGLGRRLTDWELKGVRCA